MDTQTLGFIGAGNMATALIRGLLAAGRTSPERIVASDPSADRLTQVASDFGVRTTSGPPNTAPLAAFSRSTKRR
jgi:pyrroline-5-carboxylate reductase